MCTLIYTYCNVCFSSRRSGKIHRFSFLHLETAILTAVSCPSAIGCLAVRCRMTGPISAREPSICCKRNGWSWRRLQVEEPTVHWGNLIPFSDALHEIHKICFRARLVGPRLFRRAKYHFFFHLFAALSMQRVAFHLLIYSCSRSGGFWMVYILCSS